MEAFPQGILILIVVIVFARVTVLLARRFDLPTVTVQLIIGILLGPSLFNALGTPIILGTWGSPAPSPIHAILKILAEIGLIQLMFLAGMGVDWHELRKVFRSSFSLGAWGFPLTAVSATILTRLFVGRWTEALAAGAIVSASSFGISIQHFSEMKILGSRVALMVSGAAILSSLSAILLMIASMAANYAVTFGAFKMVIAVSWFLGTLIMLLAIAYFLTSRFLKLSSKSAFEKRPRQALIGYLLLVAALYASVSMHFGSFAAVGVASLGGALLGLSKLDVKEKITKGFGSVLASIPVGILLFVIGMEVNLRAVGSSAIFLALLIGIVTASKLMGCWMATRKGHESPSERALIMFGGLYQGETGMLIAAYLFSRGLVDPSQFNIAIIVVVLLSGFTPIAMKIAQIKFGVRLNAAHSLIVGEKGQDWMTRN
jgi:Kef-type K+ transport system membrane component KefB